MEYEALGALLWPGTGSKQALASVRQCVRDLTGLLGSDRLRKPSRSELALDLTHAYVDVFAFDAAAACRELASLREAVRLYKGVLLEGCDEEWILPEREARRRAYQEALDLLVEQYQAGGDYEAAERYLRLAVAADGLKEARRCDLMRLLSRRGEHNAALEVYYHFCTLLTGPRAKPGEEMEGLRCDIREKAEQEKARSSSEASRLSPPSFRLSHPLRALVGRQEAIASVAALFTSGRLVTLKGPPGIGKTQLALHVAAHLREDYPDGAAFIDLTDGKGAEHIWRTLRTTLQIPNQPQEDTEESILGYLAPRQMLLVLDNCEHLVQDGASVIREILQECPYVRILSTSRMAWDIHPGERIYAVMPLTLPAPKLLQHLPSDPLPDLSGFTAIRLFEERTSEHLPTFALTADNARTIGRICHRLDGVPLAIQLAAGWMQALTPEEILERLSDGLDLLRDTRQHTPVRHNRLITTLETSYRFLSPPLQRLFQQVSVFRDGWSLQAAETVCDTPCILDNLRRLQERSLVEAEPAGSEMRFRLLGTLRQFAGRLLEESSAEVTAVRSRHLDFYLHVAEKAEPELVGAGQEAVLARLDREFDNLTEALKWAHESQETEKGLRLAGALWRYWHIRGQYEEGLDCLERFLRQDTVVPLPMRSKALNGAGNLAYQWKDFERAQALFQERLELEQSQGSPRAIAGTLGGLANVASARGDYAQARTLFERSLASFRELGDRRGTVMTLGNLAVVSCQEGDLPRACLYHAECAAFFRSDGDLHSLAVALNNLAGIRISLEDYSAGTELLKESLDISRELESRHSLLHGLTLSFFMSSRRDQWEQAALLLGATEAFRERTQLPLPKQVLDEHAHHEERVRAGLGAEAFSRVRSQGRLLTLEETVARASSPQGPQP